jgi:hypothetical protein
LEKLQRRVDLGFEKAATAVDEGLEKASRAVDSGVDQAVTWWTELVSTSTGLTLVLVVALVFNLRQWIAGREERARGSMTVRELRAAEDELRRERRERQQLQRAVDDSVVRLQQRRGGPPPVHCRPRGGEDGDQPGGAGGDAAVAARGLLDPPSSASFFARDHRGVRHRLSSTRIDAPELEMTDMSDSGIPEHESSFPDTLLHNSRFERRQDLLREEKRQQQQKF